MKPNLEDCMLCRWGINSKSKFPDTLSELLQSLLRVAKDIVFLSWFVCKCGSLQAKKQIIEDIDIILCECQALLGSRLDELGAYFLLPEELRDIRTTNIIRLVRKFRCVRNDNEGSLWTILMCLRMCF
uniref:Uncharacterized protein n=1 Tax=Megaselia scalaris TaxID=36166 RepID=T1GVW3_MEGSC